jgi:hypothetical protein
MMLVSRAHMLKGLRRRRLAGVGSRSPAELHRPRAALTFRRKARAGGASERVSHAVVNVSPLLHFHLHWRAMWHVQRVMNRPVSLTHARVPRIPAASRGMANRRELSSVTRAALVSNPPARALSFVAYSAPMRWRVEQQSVQRSRRAEWSGVSTTSTHARRAAALTMCPRRADPSPGLVPIRRGLAGVAAVAGARVRADEPPFAPVPRRVAAWRGGPVPSAPMRARRIAAITPGVVDAEPSRPPWARSRSPVSLVWRRSSGDAGESTRSAPEPVRASAAAMPSTAIPPDVPGHVRTAAARPMAPAFDASMVERLTDDVIRKIEKRVRIERERQGL